MTPLQLQRLEQNRLETERLKANHPLEQIFWECTLRCNLACRHCGSDCTKDLAASEMPLDSFLPVLDEITTHTSPASVLVNTVGGEPLVRRDLALCGKAIKQRGFRWGTVSNGFLLDRPMLDSLLDAGLDTIAIDLDGTPESHNWLRNNPQSFDRAINAIRLVSGTPDLTSDVITCVNSRNFQQLSQIKRLLIDAGVTHWRCFTIIPMGRATGDDSLQITDSQFRDLMNFIVETRLEGKIDLTFACEGFLGAYEGIARDYFFRCEAGLTVASIRANGDIAGCLSIRSDYNQGNIYRDSFWDVWQHRFQAYRDRRWMHRGPCADCEALPYCDGGAFHLRNDGGNMLACNYLRLKNVKL